jgi:hypothetical protein
MLGLSANELVALKKIFSIKAPTQNKWAPNESIIVKAIEL